MYSLLNTIKNPLQQSPRITHTAVGVLYLLLSLLGALAHLSDSLYQGIWLPTGFAIAAILLIGPSTIWVICAAAFIAELILPRFLQAVADQPLALSTQLLSALLYTAVTACHLFISHWLIHRFSKAPWTLSSNQQILTILVSGGLLASAFSSSLHTLAALALGHHTSNTLAAGWFNGWIQDATAVILVTPLLLILIQETPFTSRRRKQLCTMTAAIVLFTLYLSQALFMQFNQQRLNYQLKTSSNAVLQLVQDEVLEINQSLSALQAFFQANTKVDRQAFKVFTQRLLESHPTVLAYEWAPKVPFEQREAYETAARATTFPFFNFSEKKEGELVTASKAPFYYPVYFIEPLSGNESALGYNLYSTQTVRDTIDKTLRTVRQQASPPIQLNKNPHTHNTHNEASTEPYSHWGYLLIAPTHPAQSENVVIALIDINHIIEKVKPLLEQHHLIFSQLLDSGAQLIPPPKTAGIENSTYFTHQHVLLADREWFIRIHFDAEYLEDALTHPLALLYLLGLILTGLAVFTTLVTTGEQAKIDREISEKTVAIERNQEFLNTLVYSLPMSVIILNREGTILYCNPAALVMFLADDGGLVGHHCNHFLTTKHRNFIRVFLKRYFKRPLRMEPYGNKGMTLLRNTGDLFIGKISLSPIAWEDQPASLVLIEDITEHAKIQDELHLRVKELEQTRHSLLTQARELATAKLQADEAAIAKGQFLASMSHEIRTPLNAIIGFANFLLKSPLNSMQTDRMQRICYASDHLLGIINDILDFSKIEAGKMKLENISFSLRHELCKTVDLFDEAATEKGIQVHIEIEPTIDDLYIGDPLRMRQIITNLLSNALKFTKTGYIKTTVTYANEQPQEKDKKLLHIAIQDTGIGISKKQQKRLFASFTQADGSTSRKYGGSGLGLSISKALAELMDGDITLTSEEGKGSCFTIEVALPTDTVMVSTQNAPIENQSAEQPGYDLIDLKDHKEFSDKTLLMTLSSKEDQTIILNYCHYIQTEHTLNVHCCDPDTIYEKMIELQPDALLTDDITLFKSETFPANLPILIICKTGVIMAKQRLLESRTWIADVIEAPYNDQQLIKSLLNTFDQHSWSAAVRSTEGAQHQDNLNDFKLQLQGRIILTDDNLNNQMLASDLLEDLGIQFDIANNGLEAVNLLKENPDTYSLVLMDIQMPVMDGLEATRTIRAEVDEHIPILAMTANAMSDDIENCEQAGMNAHIAKPIDVDILTKELLKYLKSNMVQNTVQNKQPERSPEPEEPTIATKPPTPASSKNQTMLCENLPGLAIDEALSRLGGKTSLYLRLLKDFSENYLNSSEEIAKLLKEGDTDSARRAAHTMKGLAGAVGATNLQESATLLEKLIKSEAEMASILTSLQTFSDSFEEAIESVNTLIRREEQG